MHAELWDERQPLYRWSHGRRTNRSPNTPEDVPMRYCRWSCSSSLDQLRSITAKITVSTYIYSISNAKFVLPKNVKVLATLLNNEQMLAACSELLSNCTTIVTWCSAWVRTSQLPFHQEPQIRTFPIAAAIAKLLQNWLPYSIKA